MRAPLGNTLLLLTHLGFEDILLHKSFTGLCGAQWIALMSNPFRFFLVALSLAFVASASPQVKVVKVKHTPFPPGEIVMPTQPVTSAPFNPLIDPRTGKAAAPTTMIVALDGKQKQITIKEFWRQMSVLEVSANARGFTLHGQNLNIQLQPKFGLSDLKQQVAAHPGTQLNPKSLAMYHSVLSRGLMFPDKLHPTTGHIPTSSIGTSMAARIRPTKVPPGKPLLTKPSQIASLIGTPPPPVPTQLFFAQVHQEPDQQGAWNFVPSGVINAQSGVITLDIHNPAYGSYMWQAIDLDATPNGFILGDPNFGDMTPSVFAAWTLQVTPSTGDHLITINPAIWGFMNNPTRHLLFRVVPIAANNAAVGPPSNTVEITVAGAANYTDFKTYSSQMQPVPAGQGSPSFNDTWGDPSIMAFFVKGGITATGDANNRTETATFAAGVDVLSNELDAIDANFSATVFIPSAGQNSPPTAQGTLSVKLFGDEVVPNGSGTQSGWDGQVVLGDANLVDEQISASFQQGIPLGPLDVSISGSIGGDFGVGAGVTIDIGSQYSYAPNLLCTPIGFSLTPHASLTAGLTGSVGIGIDGFDIVSVGADLNLDILELTSAFTIDDQGDYSFALESAQILRGSIDAFAKIGPCPFCAKFSVNICSWTGIDLTGGQPVSLFQGTF